MLLNEAIDDAQLQISTIAAADTALIGATTVGGMCLMDELYRDANSDTASVYAASYDCASVNMFLQKRYGMSGIVNTINTACSSSANAIMYGARLIRNGLANRVIVGGVTAYQNSPLMDLMHCIFCLMNIAGLLTGNEKD
jgi:3-oxoacyl-(acyl-carrier-protein) synthase